MSAIEEMEMELSMENGMKKARVEELMEKKNEFTVLSDISISFAHNEPDPDSKREEMALSIMVTVKKLNRMSEKQKRVLIACLVERRFNGYQW